VENGCRPRAYTEGQEHVADLADGRIGEDSLDVRLGCGAEAGQKERCRTDEATSSCTDGASVKITCVLATR